MKVSWRTEAPQWALLAAMLLLAAVTWRSAPERMPVHWDAVGQVDRYGGKVEALLLPPAIALGVYLLLLFLPRVDPGRKSYALFQGAYATLRLATIVVLAIVYAVTHLTLRGHPVDMPTVLPLLVGGLCIVAGNAMGKIRPNWFVGIRTPWTLSSKMAWVRTHRLGGWLFVVLGLALIGAGLLRVPWAFGAWLALALAGIGAAHVYSYLVWRDDPDKIPPAGTLPL